MTIVLYNRTRAFASLGVARHLSVRVQMVNLGPQWDTLHWPDNWTATTVDGKRSAQFEETLL
jgi:methionyl aminopeptidase